jgi:hypothetical protein
MELSTRRGCAVGAVLGAVSVIAWSPARAQFGVQAYGYVAAPSDGPSWTLRLEITFLAPQ